MTPLIDVVFILLVFFMVTSYLLPTGYLELDNSTASGGVSDGTPLPQLQLVGPDSIEWQNQTWAVSDVIRQLQRDGHTEVRLATDGAVELEQFTRTLSGLDQAGIKAHWKRTPPQDMTPSQP